MLNFVINNLKGKPNVNLPYNYNLNKKNQLIKLTDQNNIKRVRGKNRKTNKTKKKKRY